MYEDRISHALLVLSTWLMSTYFMFVYPTMKSNTISIIGVRMLGVVEAIYFTPLDRYNQLFTSDSYVLAICVGILFLGVTYMNLIRMRRSLLTRHHT